MNNIIFKEQFVKIFDNIKAIRKFEDEVYEVFDKYGHEAPNFPTLEDDLVNTLSVMFGQDTDYSDLVYFIYEMNLGKDYTPGCFTVDGKDIDISTPEKLYDWLLEDMKREKDEENHRVS